MDSRYERCGECGCEYERDYMRQIGERRICSMCRWLGAACARRPAARKAAAAGGKRAAGARR